MDAARTISLAPAIPSGLVDAGLGALGGESYAPYAQ